MNVLLGITLPSTNPPVPDLRFFDPSLNSSQKEAVQFALQSSEVACIHGPPGRAATFQSPESNLTLNRNGENAHSYRDNSATDVGYTF